MKQFNDITPIYGKNCISFYHKCMRFLESCIGSCLHNGCNRWTTITRSLESSCGSLWHEIHSYHTAMNLGPRWQFRWNLGNKRRYSLRSLDASVVDHRQYTYAPFILIFWNK
jgi:hypothetical protein